ncbi:MAG: ornithine carbamoyltransferase [Candidatus Freyarchaeota archaeon]|nr:ornithine carbamoyltransferase [Candidatus Jordarchaeia archaeon]
MVRHFLSLMDISPEELKKIICEAEKFKKSRVRSSILNGRVLAALFLKPSTRTRVSFEVAVRQLGGDFIFLRGDELQTARGEPLKDTARVLGRYVDGIIARVYSHRDLETLAEYSGVPVINALSDMEHPCQALADMLTVKEKLGRLNGITLAFVGDGNNVCNSLILACTMLGVNIRVATPEGYEPAEEIVKAALAMAPPETEIQILNSPEKAVEGADVVYTDVFVSMGDEAEANERLSVFLPRFQVNRELLNLAKPSAILMHCLPAHRGEEITEDTLEGEHSVVWDQAENRLHAQKALLNFLYSRQDSSFK